MIEYSVLIIDDDVWMQRILAKTLNSYGFKKSFLASNGFDGIASAVENIPYLIIMDILMPEMSGHLALKIIKRIHLTKDIPVLMVSALSDSENLRMAIQSGTAGFISKPFTRATIFEKLVSIFGIEKLDYISRGEPIPPELEFEDYSEYEYPEDTNQEHEDSLDIIDVPDDDSDSEIKTQKIDISQNRVSKYYQTNDERRNIESIKKLLSKIKK